MKNLTREENGYSTVVERVIGVKEMKVGLSGLEGDSPRMISRKSAVRYRRKLVDSSFNIRLVR